MDPWLQKWTTEVTKIHFLPYSGIYLFSCLSSLLVFLLFFSLCLTILPNFTFFILFYSKLYLLILIWFFPTTPSIEGGKIKVWKTPNTIEMNCQFQLTTHNEAQQENVSQVERSVKHSKIAQICKRQFCWNSHDNTRK